MVDVAELGSDVKAHAGLKYGYSTIFAPDGDKYAYKGVCDIFAEEDSINVGVTGLEAKNIGKHFTGVQNRTWEKDSDGRTYHRHFPFRMGFSLV